jgi:hypothetical protein
MEKFKGFLSFLLLNLFIGFPYLLFAQDDSVEMADTMRQNGKIYVVVAVVSIILLGLLLALINLDRKVKRLEKERRKD